MQNQMNQMSSFEFISILMSIIIGLGVTNLLAAPDALFTGADRIRWTKSTC